MLIGKKTIVIILASLAIFVVGVFGYLRYAEFCQPILQSDAYDRDQIKRGIVVRATNPAIIRELDAGLKEYNKKRSWGEWWQETKFSGCSKIFPPQQITLPAPFMPVMPTMTPQQVPPQTQTPTDTRSWGERFKDPAIPEVTGVEWQTYTNKEYGFEMEYPMGMEIETGGNSQDGSAYIYFDPSPHRPFNTFLAITVSSKSLRERFQEDLYVVYRRKLENMTPDATINGLGIIIEGPDEDPNSNGSNALVVYLEKYGHSYHFVEVHHESDNERDMQIIERMIKTFHFLK